MIRGLFPAFFLALTVAMSIPAAAQPRHSRDGVQPLDKLLPQIRRQHPGSIYDAQGPMRGPNGDPRYRLKWMTPDGRIIWLDTDARNGRVLDASPGRFRGERGRYGPRRENPRARDFGRRRR